MPASEADSKCVCGHEHRHHFGAGPCIARYELASGKLAQKTVCPCLKFEAKS